MFDGLTAVGGMMVKWRKYREYGKSSGVHKFI